MDAKLFLMAGCLAGIVSACMHEKSDSASDIQQAVHTLVLEADSLMQSDSLFWNQPIDKSHPQVCIHDSLIRQKLDSALALRPDKQTYLLKYRYLLQSWRLLEVLDLLRDMDGCMSDSMSSELLHLKAVLEDYKGDTLTARRDFLRADSAYTIKIQQVAQDSLMYGFARIEKALNLSLMQNDFRPLHEEIAFYERVHSSSINGIEQWKQITDKAAYYRKMFE
ncbi:hypothetical protein ACJEEM_03345 [Phocaeicola plebeius]|uniref:hypothetical protein n=1 Tax=Phocaeicola plebeius TaxID=310297 RepID=UPI00397C79C5